jgi:hypothetical protein
MTDEDISRHLHAVQLGRLPRLREVGDSAVNAASDSAGAIRGYKKRPFAGLLRAL